MSFNMLCGLCDPSRYGTWEEREDGLTDTLRRANPDLLATQEMMFRSNLDTVIRALPKMSAHYLDHGLPYYDSVVFFDQQKFDLLDKGEFWLSESPDAMVGLGWRLLSLPRDAVWVLLRDKSTGAEFYFVGTHFDNNRANKEPSAELLRRRITHFKDKPVILAGDFNSKPGSVPSRRLVESLPGDEGFADSFELARESAGISNRPEAWAYGCSSQRHRFPDCRIDYILLSREIPWQVQRYTVDAARYGWRKQLVSDHRPIWAEISWDQSRAMTADARLAPPRR
jgi:endonuclease/exonuclease/phosphatase family metal-dependent hydrolase